MKYPDIVTGIFLQRINRFIAHVAVRGKEERVHVKNTGRLKELLVPGAVCYLQEHAGQARKTGYSLIAVKKGDRIVNIDSQVPNKVVQEALAGGLELPGLSGKVALIRPECQFGDSRFDFYIETDHEKAFIEVKGVTLEAGGVAMFPDAPTVRGVKHVKELIAARKAGFKSYIIFVVQMRGVDHFTPNDAMHREFGDAVREAANSGVWVLAYDCHAVPDELVLGDRIGVML
ncbi:MAG TPA: DNA/RNA nuclease SfsA [Candidatus Atribacteria bacterium]|nr:DNA/RNA nuclease SfsA [Candidatus Atribacteria bacterium]HPT77692.1 DNA/RNA nuclease SfsA [Candidatus Atribacteria bacterium]